MIAFYALIALYLALQVLDVVATMKALRYPHIRETNPIVRWMMARTGSPLAGLLLSKAICAPAIAILAVMAGPTNWSWLILGGLVLLYAWTVRRNFALARP